HEAIYQPIQNILFACDYKQVAKTTPVQPIETNVQQTNAHLHVLHVADADKKAVDFDNEVATLKNALQNASPQFHVVQSADFSNAIATFIAQNNIQLLIAIPKRHGFFEGLFHRSHVKTLAFHTHVPLMLVHEE
ncbi:MAG: universal stress protein, partial [Bacteroidota bacterium]|nr:universal stress protein [Bacteroidota bacterium]